MWTHAETAILFLPQRIFISATWHQRTQKVEINLLFQPIRRIFATMNENMTTEKWCENVIIADGDYIDKVAFNLIVNFERMIGRRIPQADMARWIDCVALDGGMKPAEQPVNAQDSSTPAPQNQTSVIFIHDKQSDRLQNFTPGHYVDDLHMKAFSDSLGEFMMSAFPVEESVVTKRDFFIDVTKTICNLKEVKRVMIIPDAERIYDDVRLALKDADDEKRITVFAMQPMPGGNFRQEILGYSLMQALGIRASEIG